MENQFLEWKADQLSLAERLFNMVKSRNPDAIVSMAQAYILGLKNNTFRIDTVVGKWT